MLATIIPTSRRRTAVRVLQGGLVAGLLVGAPAVRGWQPGASLALLVGGLLLIAAGGGPAGAVIASLAAWQTPPKDQRGTTDGLAAFMAPAGFTAAAAALLIAGRFVDLTG